LIVFIFAIVITASIFESMSHLPKHCSQNFFCKVSNHWHERILAAFSKMCFAIVEALNVNSDYLILLFGCNNNINKLAISESRFNGNHQIDYFCWWAKNTSYHVQHITIMSSMIVWFDFSYDWPCILQQIHILTVTCDQPFH